MGQPDGDAIQILSAKLGIATVKIWRQQIRDHLTASRSVVLLGSGRNYCDGQLTWRNLLVRLFGFKLILGRFVVCKVGADGYLRLS
ncbi:hypothetical protein ACNKHW_15160 [Shigella flexneri]